MFVRRWLGVVFCCAVLATGCGGERRTDASPAPRAAVPAIRPPADADFSAFVETYYQQIGSRHAGVAWRYLTPRYQSQLSESAFRRLYAGLEDADVDVRQSGEHRALATLRVGARAGSPARSVGETLTVVWDGSTWQVDDITRR